MHKKLEAELVSLAHDILQMKNRDDVNALHKKAQDISEKLFLLKFVEDYINTTPDSFKNKEEIIDKIENVFEEVTIEEETLTYEFTEETAEGNLISHEQVEEIFHKETTFIKDDAKDIPSLKNTLEEELKDAISADFAADLFEKATKENPVVEEKKRSLNDALYKNNLQIGLNDRIAFVKYLFEGNQEDFNRVLSQLNTFDTEKEAKNFIFKMVKPDYNWNDKEEFELRLLNLIERKFL